MKKHSLYSQNQERVIEWFEKFDAIKIKNAIVKHLENNPTDVIEHCREYSKEDMKKYYGNEILNFYQMNKKNKPAKVVFKGNKEYLQELS